MARGDISGEVLTYLRNHRGETIKLDDITRATGFTQTQIQNAMRAIKNKRAWPVVTLIQGKWWRSGLSETVVKPVTPPEPETTEPRPKGMEPKVAPDLIIPPIFGQDRGKALVDSIHADQRGASEQYGRPESTMSNWKGAEPDLDIPRTAPATRTEVFSKTVTTDQSDHLFEYLGARPHGKILLRRDDGDLFEATLEQI